jgi:hypothetical protein
MHRMRVGDLDPVNAKLGTDMPFEPFYSELVGYVAPLNKYITAKPYEVCGIKGRLEIICRPSVNAPGPCVEIVGKNGSGRRQPPTAPLKVLL